MYDYNRICGNENRGGKRLCSQIIANDVDASRCKESSGTLDRIDPKELQISRKLFAPDVTSGFCGLPDKKDSEGRQEH